VSNLICVAPILTAPSLLLSGDCFAACHAFGSQLWLTTMTVSWGFMAIYLGVSCNGLVAEAIEVPRYSPISLSMKKSGILSS